MNQLKQIITKVKFQLYFMAGLRCLLVASSAYFAVLLLLQSSSFAIIAFVISLLLMAYFTKLFQDKSTETIHLIHQKITNTEYSLELLTVENPNLAEQLQLERIFSNEHFQTPWVLIKNSFFMLLFSLFLGFCMLSFQIFQVKKKIVFYKKINHKVLIVRKLMFQHSQKQV